MAPGEVGPGGHPEATWAPRSPSCPRRALHFPHLPNCRPHRPDEPALLSASQGPGALQAPQGKLPQMSTSSFLDL